MYLSDRMIVYHAQNLGFLILNTTKQNKKLKGLKKDPEFFYVLIKH